MKISVGPTLHYNKMVLKLSTVTYAVREIETACGMERDLYFGMAALSWDQETCVATGSEWKRAVQY
jgi:hypothetical protein